jgi:hypothetical protein
VVIKIISTRLSKHRLNNRIAADISLDIESKLNALNEPISVVFKRRERAIDGAAIALAWCIITKAAYRSWMPQPSEQMYKILLQNQSKT